LKKVDILYLSKQKLKTNIESFYFTNLLFSIMKALITLPFSTMKEKTSNFTENKEIPPMEVLMKIVNKE